MSSYAVLDGFDLGAGIVHLLVARTEPNAVGPGARSAPYGTATRSGRSPAAAPLLRVSRGLCFELQRILLAADDCPLAADPARDIDRIPQQGRRTGLGAVLDILFAGSSALFAGFYGAAIGNVIRGVPLGREGYFF